MLAVTKHLTFSPPEGNGKISTGFTEVQFQPVEGNERLTKMEIANTKLSQGKTVIVHTCLLY